MREWCVAKLGQLWQIAAALELVQHASKLHVKGYQESTILFGIQVFVEVLGEHIQRNVQCLTRNEHLQHGKLSRSTFP
jgi:hypothetical protein